MEGIAIVGAGAVGTALGRALFESGSCVDAVISRTVESAEQLSKLVEAPVAADSIKSLPRRSAVVVLCVPDASIREVARAMSVDAPGPWTGRTVLHTSGAFASDRLQPVATAGANAGSFHPVLSLIREAPPGLFRGARVHLEGDDEAVAAGREIAHAIGSIPRRLTAEQKSLVHVAATFASNYLVTLADLAGELLEIAGLTADDAENVLRPLLEVTLQNLDVRQPPAALTGPIARGDLETVRRHLEILAESAPHVLTAYCALAAEAVRTAVKGGHIGPDAANRLLDDLARAARGMY